MSKARDLANAGTALGAVTATELGYVDGVTSAIQTQLNAKQAVVSGVNDTEIGYLDGVTSAIQTQIDSKIGSASAINPTIVDAKGDIIAATAADTVARLAVGSNDQVLTADSTTATGLKWATPAAGGMTLISETTASSLTSLSFSSIPGTYKQLLLTWSGLSTPSESTTFFIRLNNSSSLVYAQSGLVAAGGTPAVSLSRNTEIGSNGLIRNATGTTLDLLPKGYLIIDNYASTTRFKNYSYNNSFRRPATGDDWLEIIEGVFSSTSAITSIDIVRTTGSGTFNNATSTSIRLYGIS